MSDIPSIAVVGTGYWGKNLVRNFYELGALRFICDKDKDLSAKYLEKYPGIAFSDDIRSLLDDPNILPP